MNDCTKYIIDELTELGVKIIRKVGIVTDKDGNLIEAVRDGLDDKIWVVQTYNISPIKFAIENQDKDVYIMLNGDNLPYWGEYPNYQIRGILIQK